MISIQVQNGPKRERELMEDLAYYCLKKLMPRKKRIEIDIKQIKDLPAKQGAAATVVDTDDLFTYEMNIDKDMTLRKKLLSVSHEMVHIKQFSRKELEHTDSIYKSKWKGKVYNYHKIHYYDMPWEIEAYGRELGLFDRWVIDNSIKGKFTIDN